VLKKKSISYSIWGYFYNSNHCYRTFSILFFYHPLTTNASLRANTLSYYGTTDSTELENDFILKYETTEILTHARTATKTAVRTAACEYKGKTIAVIKLTAAFSYTGSSALCTNASAFYTAYDGWTFSDESTRRSGKTAAASAKISKGKEFVNVSVSMKCKKSGTIL